MVVVGVPPVVGFLVAAHYFAPAQEECATAMGADGLGGGVGRCFDGDAFRRQCDFHCRRLSERDAGLVQQDFKGGIRRIANPAQAQCSPGRIANPPGLLPSEIQKS